MNATRTHALAAGLLAAALVGPFAGPAAAQITSGPQLSISVQGGQPEYAFDFLPGQPVPVQTSFVCDFLCQQGPLQAEWWIWAELPGDVPEYLSYDGSTQSWRRGLAPSFVRPAADQPLELLPGRLCLPGPGYWNLHFELDTDPNGQRDTAVDGVWWLEAQVSLPYPPYFTYYQVQVDPGFFEDFNDGKADTWVDDVAAAWAVDERHYRVTATGPLRVFASVFDRRFTHFTYGADVRLISGGAGADKRGFGLLFRSSGGYANGYVFHINAAGSYLIFKRVGGATVPLMAGWKPSGAIRTGAGAWNRLEVRARRDQLEFRINGTLVKRLRDGRFTRGKAGLKAYGDSAAGDRFEFDNAALRVEFVD